MDITDLESALKGLRVVQRDLRWALSNASPVEAMVLMQIISTSGDMFCQLEDFIQAVEK